MSHRIRFTEPRDLPALWRIADAQNRRDGTNYPVPIIFEMDESKSGFGQLVQNVPLALTTERDGRVRRVDLFLRTIEVMGFGGGADDVDFATAHIPMALDYLRRRGYESVHALVPAPRATEALGKLLHEYGMTRIDHRLAHFFSTI